jgi:pimeloyl-ACP methyl ester carboxylesterase
LYERLAAHCTLVRYDHRGLGLSDRVIGAFSLDGFVSDIEAVVGGLQLDEVMLLSPDTSEMPIAVAYAAHHRDRVSRLALTSAYPRATTALRAHIAELKALMAVRPEDWKFGANAVARAAGGWEKPQAWSMAFSQLLRAAVTAETFTRYLEWQETFDVTALLPRVIAPTLIVQNTEEGDLLTEAGTREFITLMRDARAVVIDPRDHDEWGSRWLEEVSQFLLGVKLSDGLSRRDAHHKG